MSVYDTHTRTYVCDRGGETLVVEGNGVSAPNPPGWTPLLYGADVLAALIPAAAKGDAPVVKPFWLCDDCGKWLRKFLEGRKVVD